MYQEITDFEVLWKCEKVLHNTNIHTYIYMQDEYTHTLSIHFEVIVFRTSCLDGVFYSALNWINRGNYLCLLAAINYKRWNVHSNSSTFNIQFNSSSVRFGLASSLFKIELFQSHFFQKFFFFVLFLPNL